MGDPVRLTTPGGHPRQLTPLAADRIPSESNLDRSPNPDLGRVATSRSLGLIPTPASHSLVAPDAARFGTTAAAPWAGLPGSIPARRVQAVLDTIGRVYVQPDGSVRLLREGLSEAEHARLNDSLALIFPNLDPQATHYPAHDVRRSLGPHLESFTSVWHYGRIDDAGFFTFVDRDVATSGASAEHMEGWLRRLFGQAVHVISRFDGGWAVRFDGSQLNGAVADAGDPNAVSAMQRNLLWADEIMLPEALASLFAHNGGALQHIDGQLVVVNGNLTAQALASLSVLAGEQVVNVNGVLRYADGRPAVELSAAVSRQLLGLDSQQSLTFGYDPVAGFKLNGRVSVSPNPDQTFTLDLSSSREARVAAARAEFVGERLTQQIGAVVTNGEFTEVSNRFLIRPGEPTNGDVTVRVRRDGVELSGRVVSGPLEFGGRGNIVRRDIEDRPGNWVDTVVELEGHVALRPSIGIPLGTAATLQLSQEHITRSGRRVQVIAEESHPVSVSPVLYGWDAQTPPELPAGAQLSISGQGTFSSMLRAGASVGAGPVSLGAGTYGGYTVTGDARIEMTGLGNEVVRVAVHRGDRVDGVGGVYLQLGPGASVAQGTILQPILRQLSLRAANEWGRIRADRSVVEFDLDLNHASARDLYDLLVRGAHPDAQIHVPLDHITRLGFAADNGVTLTSRQDTELEIDGLEQSLTRGDASLISRGEESISVLQASILGMGQQSLLDLMGLNRWFNDESLAAEFGEIVDSEGARTRFVRTQLERPLWRTERFEQFGEVLVHTNRFLGLPEENVASIEDGLEVATGHLSPDRPWWRLFIDWLWSVISGERRDFSELFADFAMNDAGILRSFTDESMIHQPIRSWEEAVSEVGPPSFAEQVDDLIEARALITGEPPVSFSGISRQLEQRGVPYRDGRWLVGTAGGSIELTTDALESIRRALLALPEGAQADVVLDATSGATARVQDQNGRAVVHIAAGTDDDPVELLAFSERDMRASLQARLDAERPDSLERRVAQFWEALYQGLEESVRELTRDGATTTLSEAYRAIPKDSIDAYLRDTVGEYSNDEVLIHQLAMMMRAGAENIHVEAGLDLSSDDHARVQSRGSTASQRYAALLTLVGGQSIRWSEPSEDGGRLAIGIRGERPAQYRAALEVLFGAEDVEEVEPGLLRVDDPQRLEDLAVLAQSVDPRALRAGRIVFQMESPEAIERRLDRFLVDGSYRYRDTGLTLNNRGYRSFVNIREALHEAGLPPVIPGFQTEVPIADRGSQPEDRSREEGADVRVLHSRIDPAIVASPTVRGVRAELLSN